MSLTSSDLSKSGSNENQQGEPYRSGYFQNNWTLFIIFNRYKSFLMQKLFFYYSIIINVE